MPKSHQIDLCGICDTKIAVALVKLLPHLAGDIDPNCFSIVERQEAEAAAQGKESRDD
jgi:hypothetical protein